MCQANSYVVETDATRMQKSSLETPSIYKKLASSQLKEKTRIVSTVLCS